MPRIEIDRLSLRLSGLSEDQGRLLAMRVAEGLITSSPEPGAPVELDAIRVSAAMVPGSTVNMLADQIVADLVRQLNRTM